MENHYSFNLKVSKEDIDHLNHVNNVVYVNWVLKAAEKHWAILSSNAMNDAFVWVVLRHEIDYKAAAMLGDGLTVKTWIGESYGVKSDRFVAIYKGDVLLVKAKTSWCLLDKKSMRAVRIPQEILAILK